MPTPTSSRDFHDAAVTLSNRSHGRGRRPAFRALTITRRKLQTTEMPVLSRFRTNRNDLVATCRVSFRPGPLP